MKITGTFLDEISHDIPHQNWGYEDWNKDFQAMKDIGINKVILIRSGYKKWMTFPSDVIAKEMNAFLPPVDLVKMFLDLSEKWGMDFWFGLYDSGYYWFNGEYEKERDINIALIDEVWSKYGSSPAFKGWYLSQEFSRKAHGLIEIYTALGKHCKAVSGGLPTLISPYIQGRKARNESAGVTRDDSITPEQHEKEWSEIMSGISGAVDIVAFQDGHVDFSELPEFLEINKKIADKNSIKCWTNSETFDRDMPIKFLPIKWEKLLLKLKAAEEAGYDDAITFEFSHFLSPNSCYAQAHGLYKLYSQYLEGQQ